ncbi:MAG: sigma-54 dependent transcriptional regulator [Longimicrobiales bacterium]|nr:sigma-54 dependent transcriptional regulator [Longimicrobiales bacterium]
MTPASILIVHSDPELREHLARTLEREQRTIRTAGDARGALALVRANVPDLLLTARRLPEMSGIELVTILRQEGEEGDMEALLLSDDDAIELLMEAHRLGAWVVPGDPPDADELERAMKEALTVARIREEGASINPPLPAEVESGTQARLVGSSEAMAEVRHQIAKFARSDVKVLVVGENGSGKEVVVRLLHEHSERSGEPFVDVRLGSLAATLAESELFGHVKGAFTGAHHDRRGAFERAGRGTVFLDEIGDLPLEVQPKLLAVLQEREFTPVGGDTVRSVGARVISATHRDLQAGVEEGWFREDLFYRLKAGVIRLPPLRERMEDLEELVDHLLARAAAEIGGGRRMTLSPDALLRLRQHTWPGNVRELAHCLHQAVVQAPRDVILAPHLELESVNGEGGRDGAAGGGEVPAGVGTGGPRAARSVTSPVPWVDPDGNVLTLEEADRLHIAFALRQTDGNVAEAARLLGVARSTLRSRMKALGMRRDTSSR